jgi:hypothetical protein
MIQQAPALSMTEFAQLAQSVVISNTSYTVDDGRLADIDRKLSKIRVITPVGPAHLDRILARGLELRSQAHVDATLAAPNKDVTDQAANGLVAPPSRE